MCDLTSINVHGTCPPYSDLAEMVLSNSDSKQKKKRYQQAKSYAKTKRCKNKPNLSWARQVITK